MGLPRGSAIAAKGGNDSFYAVDYAARVASELGADVVKVNFPHPEKHGPGHGEYETDVTTQAAINVWQREHDESLRPVTRLRDILEKYPTA